MTLPLKRTDLSVPNDKTVIDRLFFNRRFDAIFNGLSNLDGRMAVYDAQVASLVTIGLQRLNDALGPMLTTLQEAAQLGFLTCRSMGTHISLVEGEAEGFEVTDGADLFTPTPFLMVQDIDDETNWGIVSVDSGGWTKETGDLATHCVYASKTLSSQHWFISCAAATFPAMLDLLTQCVPARDVATAAEASIAADIVTLNALIAAVADGPVASVAGRTGIVTLTQDDIAGLVAALASKVDASANTTLLSGKQSASSKLDAFVSLAWAAGNLVSLTGAGSVGKVPYGTFGLALLATADVAAALTALGAATLASPALTGNPTAPTQSVGDSDTSIATTAFVSAAVAAAEVASFNDQVGTTYTLQTSDNGKVVTLTNAAAITCTLPKTLAKGFNCTVYQGGAGQVTFAVESGGTLINRLGQTKIAGKDGLVSLLVKANAGSAAAWVLAGDTG